MRADDPVPARVAETIIRLNTTADAPLNAYWLCVGGDRGGYASQLQPLLREHGLGVLIVRNNGFTNANALMLDLRELLDDNRAEFLEIVAHQRSDMSGIGLVLLARRELAMGQAYSPVTWPDWVPGVGNREVTCFITDVTRRIEVPLDAEEIDSARVQSALFAVEEALVRRLIEVHGWSPPAQQQFFDRIQRRSDPSWVAFLAGAKEAANHVRNPRSYRPDKRRGKSVVSRLWELSLETPPRKLGAIPPELASALGIGEDFRLHDSCEGLFTVLARTPEERDTGVERFGRTLLSAVPTACQFITCCAHAHEYPQFPVNLLTAFVDDLHTSLISIETSLIHLSNGGAVNGAVLTHDFGDSR